MLKKAAYWGSVVVIGITLGFSLQLVKAWTEPTLPPPGGNLGAPINTGDDNQTKTGKIYAEDVCTTSGKCLSDASGAAGTFSDLGYKMCCWGEGGIGNSKCGVARFGDVANSGKTEWSGDSNESGGCTVQLMDVSGKCIHDGILYDPGTSYTVTDTCQKIPSTCGVCIGVQMCDRQKATTIFTCENDEDFDEGVAGPFLPCSPGIFSC